VNLKQVVIITLLCLGFVIVWDAMPRRADTALYASCSCLGKPDCYYANFRVRDDRIATCALWQEPGKRKGSSCCAIPPEVKE